MPAMVRLVVSFGLLLAMPALGSAQEPGPQPCGQDAAHADYGAVTAGAVVVPQRHRYVGGDPNWDARQGRFLGRVARVVRLSGVDASGCPGVRLDVDDGRFFWRARDLSVGAERPRRELAASAGELPEACGRAIYGPLRVGSRVVLGQHRPIDGATNFTRSMRAYVGRPARIVELAGIDDHGCPGVRVDVDSGRFFWRVRDLRLPEGRFAQGMASAHGRAARDERPALAEADPQVAQACGQTDANAQYGVVAVGSEVVIGRHRPVDGEDNWVEQMDPYVGRRARVMELVGVDDQGCPLLRVDVDQGDWYWRLRDVRLP
jgi:hypothetical protein